MSISEYLINESAKESKLNRIRAIDSEVSRLEKAADEYASRHGSWDKSIYDKIQDLMDEREKLYSETQAMDESAVPMDAVNIKEVRDEKGEDDKKKLSDLRFDFDKKYNGFCLSISGYDISKLEAMHDKKKSELSAAKEKKHNAKTRFEKQAAQAEIDYLTKACHKCGAMIRKKKSYHK